MISLLLPVIYVAFVSLGLPDSLLGAAWPVMRGDVGAPLEAAGALSMIIAGGTIVSSLLSDRLTRKLGTGLVTAVSVAMTAIALAGFSLAPAFAVLCLWAVPYGLGAGAVDAALNNYVALNYKARHMSWLHCFWGVGASVGPYIMGFFLMRESSWHGGYRAVSLIQIVLAATLFATLPMWRKQSGARPGAGAEDAPASGLPPEKRTLGSVLRIRGLWLILIAFFGYCAMESTTGLWASSYLVNFRGIEPETAARFASFFYLGITGGRFVNGFVAEKLGDRALTRIGVCVAALGICLIAIPFGSDVPALAGLVVSGLGCAPVYPSIIHATPANFGRRNSQAVVGVQMASAYIGSTFMPPLFGLLAAHAGLVLYPFFLLLFALVVFCGTEALNCMKGRRGA